MTQLARKKRPHSLRSIKWIPISPYSSPTYMTIPPPKSRTFSYFELTTVYFCLFYFSKFNFTYLCHNCHNHWVFRYVLECSRMFHVPCSWFYRPPISWPQTIQVVASYLHKALLTYILLSGSVDLQFALRALTSNSSRNEWTSKDPSLLGLNTDRL